MAGHTRFHMLRNATAPSLLLVPLALALYWVPRPFLAAWRLEIYSLYLHARETAASPAPPPAGQPKLVRELRERLVQKDAEIASLRLRLGHVAELREYLPTLRFHMAGVLARPDGLQGHTIILDRGRASDVHVGDAVVQGQALVGTIHLTSARTAQAVLLSAPFSYVAAWSVTPRPDRRPVREECAVRGQGLGRVHAVFYGTDVQARRGSHLLTSGRLGSMAPDLIVGELAEDPAEGTEPNTMEAPVRLQADWLGLEHLLVIHRTGAAADRTEAKP